MTANIVDEKTDLVNTLMKIETRLLQLCEIRNHLVFKDSVNKVHPLKSIEAFEKLYHKRRIEELIKDNKPEKKRKAML